MKTKFNKLIKDLKKNLNSLKKDMGDKFDEDDWYYQIAQEIIDNPPIGWVKEWKGIEEFLELKMNVKSGNAGKAIAGKI